MSLLRDAKEWFDANFGSYQKRASDWIENCFGRKMLLDHKERNDRFLEESLGLVQSLGYTASEAHQMVEYVFNRSIGIPKQKVGGVVHTLSGLCTAHGISLVEAAEIELARVFNLKDKIRAKCVDKPRFYPVVSVTSDGEVIRALNHLQSYIDDLNDAVISNRQISLNKQKRQSLELAMFALQCAHRNGLVKDRSTYHAPTPCDSLARPDAVAACH